MPLELPDIDQEYKPVELDDIGLTLEKRLPFLSTDNLTARLPTQKESGKSKYTRRNWRDL